MTRPTDGTAVTRPTGDGGTPDRTERTTDPSPATVVAPSSDPTTGTPPPSAAQPVVATEGDATPARTATTDAPAPSPDTTPTGPDAVPVASEEPRPQDVPVQPGTPSEPAPDQVSDSATPKDPVATPAADAPDEPATESSTPEQPATEDTADPGPSPAEAAADGEDAPGEPEAPSPPPDPEQLLAAYRWHLHPETLREVVDEPDELLTIRERLTEKLETALDNRSRARLLSLRAVVSRLLGDLAEAVEDGRLAVTYAESTGELRRTAIAQARLAHVLHWKGDFAEADRLFETANSTELPDRLRATMHEHAGRCCFDQGRYMEACHHFDRALELRKATDPELTERIETALDAVFTRVAATGWGPYPRSQDEILLVRKPPTPKFDEKAQRWGYVDAEGAFAVPTRYVDVQPFKDGVAWVREPGNETWTLIDDDGNHLVGPETGYRTVGSFSDGLAWVSRETTGNWLAVDKSGAVVVSTGYRDVRPFRRGIAAVRQDGGWGAVNANGELVVPFSYSAFGTALADGRYIDGFSDEGLAVVEVNGRKGVLDRTGRIVVEPAYLTLVIHPVAFLIGESGRWGALDRRGEPLIDPVHESRDALVEEIDRLLVDTRPVL